MKQQHCYLETFQSPVWSQLGSGSIISDSQNWITHVTGNKRKRRAVFMTFNHVCSQNFINACVAECVSLLQRRHVCWRSARGTCVIQMTLMPVWVCPRCGWCMDHVVRSAQGHVGSIVLGSSLNVALDLHWVKERLRLLAAEGRRIRGAGGGVRKTHPPAGGIRCYLSDWEQHHPSPLSASLCPESNQSRVIHLRRWRADKISNRACQNFATLACCVKEIVMMYLSPPATGSARLAIKGDTAVLSLHSSSPVRPPLGFTSEPDR